MLNAPPLVTIGLSFFNARTTLGTAIRSILAQTLPDWELLLLDDGSTDGSRALVEGFPDPRIRLIPGSENLGTSQRFNHAVREARGRYFARMDADDLAFPHRLETQVAFLERHAEVDLLASAALAFHGAGVPEGVDLPGITHEEICRRPWAGFRFSHPTWMGRLAWFARHPYGAEYRPPPWDVAQDHSLLLRTWRNSRFAGLPDVLLGYRLEPRPLRKIWRSRVSFLWATVQDCWRQRAYLTGGLVTAMQFLKMGGDFLHRRMGCGSLRYRVEPPTPELLRAWKDVYLNCADEARREGPTGQGEGPPQGMASSSCCGPKE